MKLIDYFNSNQNRNMIDKWSHYFDIYERHFNPFVGKKIKVLEIGIWQGGSLKMWKDYFGEQVEIIGIDIDARCKRFEEDHIRIYIGDQSNPEFLKSVIESEWGFDIIIDDGGHRMDQQIVSFQTLYPALKNNGIYLCEDVCTSYCPVYGGGYKSFYSFIEFVKNLIDELNAFQSYSQDLVVTEFTKNTTGIHIYDSMVVFEKQNRTKPVNQRIGIKIMEDL